MASLQKEVIAAHPTQPTHQIANSSPPITKPTKQSKTLSTYSPLPEVTQLKC